MKPNMILVAEQSWVLRVFEADEDQAKADAEGANRFGLEAVQGLKSFRAVCIGSSGLGTIHCTS